MINRPGGKPYLGSEAIAGTKEAAFDSLAALTSAFENQDAVILASNPAAIVYQHNFVRAALAAKVKHLITNEFGMDTFDPNAHELPTTHAKLEAQQILEEELKNAEERGEAPSLSWTGIFTGVWYDLGIKHNFFWLDIAARKVARFGSGNQKVSMSRSVVNGEAVVAVLREPERYRNRPAYFADHIVSTNELVDLAKQISYKTEKPWEIVEMGDAANLIAKGVELWEEDKRNGVQDWLHSQAYIMINYGAMFNEDGRSRLDFGDRIEPGWLQTREQLQQQMQVMADEFGSEQTAGAVWIVEGWN